MCALSLGLLPGKIRPLWRHGVMPAARSGGPAAGIRGGRWCGGPQHLVALQHSAQQRDTNVHTDRTATRTSYRYSPCCCYQAPAAGAWLWGSSTQARAWAAAGPPAPQPQARWPQRPTDRTERRWRAAVPRGPAAAQPGQYKAQPMGCERPAELSAFRKGRSSTPLGKTWLRLRRQRSWRSQAEYTWLRQATEVEIPCSNLHQLAQRYSHFNSLCLQRPPWGSP